MEILMLIVIIGAIFIGSFYRMGLEKEKREHMIKQTELLEKLNKEEDKEK